MTYKLHTDAGNFRAFKVLIAAEYNGVNVEVVDTKTPPASSNMKKLPMLETSSGSISNTNAISRFIAGLRTDTQLLGATVFDAAQVDSWLEFCTLDIELPASIWFYPVVGYMAANPSATGKAKGDLSKALSIVNNHLKDKTYMVGEAITLADIAIASALVYPFKFVADPKFRSGYPHLMRWFNTCVNQPHFVSVIGAVVLADKESTASGAPAAAASSKKEKAPKAKAPKQEKKKEEKKKEEKPQEMDVDEKPKKKEEHIFKIMDKESPSPFVMDEWKRTYSNCSEYTEAMDVFWKTFDSKGWSIYRGDYMYNDENKILFMTSNLIGGFIQRTEEIRKWLFGTMTIRGVEGGEMKISCYYLIRGDSIEPLCKCNDSALCYNWTKITDFNEDFKKTLYDYWCSDGPLDGEACLDSRIYK